jgi:hypothetical protein
MEFLNKIIRQMIRKQIEELKPQLEEDLRKSISTISDESLNKAVNKVLEIGVPTNRGYLTYTVGAKPRPKPAYNPLTDGYYWSGSNAHWSFIDQFTTPRSIEYFDESNQRNWRETNLRATLESVVAMLLREGIIEPITIHPIDRLVRVRRKAYLVVLCAELGIDECSGTKDDLARLLWEADPDRVKSESKLPQEFEITEKGIRMLTAKMNNPLMIEKVRQLDQNLTQSNSE